ncbi:DUF3263 domain-containing protein [Micromonospora sp. B11E3]|uniref:DUF3263 domain-containing protein n=1 Tax=Micromonospora sp. B11E3 TaxID=3153562 RepID=UPI00325C663A
MPPADVSPAATDRPEPSGPGGPEGAGGVREGGGPTVPPPRSAPEASTRPSTPGREAPSGDGPGAERAPTGGTDDLTERERKILAFERRWWRHAGAKEQAIRDTFELSATRYYQLLNALLDNPAALAAEPVLVARLRRLRASRARNRRR